MKYLRFDMEGAALYSVKWYRNEQVEYSDIYGRSAPPPPHPSLLTPPHTLNQFAEIQLE
jgi:hypothetical protein